MPAMLRAISVRPAPESPQNPTTSPLRTEKEISAEEAVPPEALGPEDLRTEAGVHPGVHLVDRVTDHQLRQLPGRDLAHLVGADLPAVAHDGHPVGHLEDLRQVVRDVDDGQAAALQRADDPEQPLHLLAGQRRGRLVHHDDPGVAAQRLGDLDELHLVLGELPDLHEGIQVLQTHPLQQLPGLPDALPAVQQQALGRQPAGQHVLGHAQRVGQAQLLVDHGDPVLPGHRGGGQAHLPAVQQDGAGVVVEGPREHLHQGGLARPVLPDQGVHLPRAQVEIDVVHGQGAGKPLGHPLHAQRELFSFYHDASFPGFLGWESTSSLTLPILAGTASGGT